ncbi:histidinol-phosphate transaminase [Chloroflexota bacterium]
MAPSEGIERFIRADLKDFGAYSAHTSPETLEDKSVVPVEDIIKIDANENNYGCSPRVRQALGQYKDFNIYPDNEQVKLREVLAGYTGVSVEHIVAGHGSNQLIDLILRLLINPGEEIINCVPTFDIYRFSTRLCGGVPVRVPRKDDFSININAVKQAINDKTKAVFLANPNNPTGMLTPERDILELLDTGLPIVVDEAYYEFCGKTVVPLVNQRQNLMVLRTFSKWTGLAGLRIGYGVFSSLVADFLLRTKIPYNINVAALVAVNESFRDMDYLMSRVQAIIAEREHLFTELGKISWLKPLPSQANFILCRVLSGEAKDLKQKLQNKGILVRYFSDPILQDYIRFSVGKPKHTVALIKALGEIGG